MVAAWTNRGNSRVMITLCFEGGIHDGIELPWPGPADTCPTALEFEDRVYDRRPDEGMPWREALGVMWEAGCLGVKRHRYVLDRIEADDDDYGREEWWWYVEAGSRWAEAPDEEASTPGA